MDITEPHMHYTGRSSPVNAVAEEERRRQVTRQGREVAGAWLHDEVVRLRTERLDNLVTVLDTIHAKLIERIKIAISEGYAEGTQLSSRFIGPTTRNISSLVDELADQRSESIARDGIATAVAMHDDVRQQSLSSHMTILRSQVRDARVKALSIEAEIAAGLLLGSR